MGSVELQTQPAKEVPCSTTIFPIAARTHSACSSTDLRRQHHRPPTPVAPSTGDGAGSSIQLRWKHRPTPLEAPVSPVGSIVDIVSQHPPPPMVALLAAAQSAHLSRWKHQRRGFPHRRWGGMQQGRRRAPPSPLEAPVLAGGSTKCVCLRESSATPSLQQLGMEACNVGQRWWPLRRMSRSRAGWSPAAVAWDRGGGNCA
jgi:hypothetical protein